MGMQWRVLRVRIRLRPCAAGCDAVLAVTRERGGEEAAHPWGRSGHPADDAMAFVIPPGAREALAGLPRRYIVTPAAEGHSPTVSVIAQEFADTGERLMVRQYVRRRPLV